MTRKPTILNVSFDGALLIGRHARLQEFGYDVSSVSSWADFERACGLSSPDLLLLGQSLPPSMKHDMWDYSKKYCTATKVVEFYLHASSLPLPAGHSFNATDSTPEKLKTFIDQVMKGQ